MKPPTFLLLCSLAANAVAGYLLLSGPRTPGRSGPARPEVRSPARGAAAADSADTLGASAGATGADLLAPSPTGRSTTLVSGVSLLDHLANTARIHGAAKEEIPGLIGQALAMAPSASRTELLARLYQRWGEVDPVEAFGAIAQMSATERQARELDILRGWAFADPAAAWEWMDRNPPPITSTTVNPANAARYQALADTLLAADRPDLLKTALARTRDDAERSLLAVRIADYLARYDTPGAVDWLLELPAGPARTSAAARLARTIAEESPDLALGLATKLPGNAGRNQAIASVFTQWADTGDTAAAESWLAAQKPAPVIDSALLAFLPVTATRDEAAAQRLLDRFSQPANRQRAVDLAANKLALLDPARAIEWTVNQSPDSPERLKKLQPFMKSWVKSDAAGAASGLATLPGLTPAEREALGTLIPPPPAPPAVKK